ncbi:hypothetical protein CSKR_113156 [Clonorchis sinensis]|uniref:Post-SET domain-containing protein n=1 Tax=Clonorchis sinensis TaxID=79923 RepID=A0A8T1MXP4_CLOSI|nr:hypothetical protein CSKR_113156 [Clonorchis sinensis]
MGNDNVTSLVVGYQTGYVFRFFLKVKSANIVLIPLYPAAADQLYNSVGYSPDHHDNKPCAQVDLDVDGVERTSDESIGNNKPTALLCISLRNASTNSSYALSTGEDLGRWCITFVPKVHQTKIMEFFFIACLTGHTPQALLGQTLDSFIHPSDSRHLSQWLSVDALNGKNETEKEADTLECRWRCANCTYTWLSISRVCSTQVLDQTTAPSISNNLHFYRLTWLSGPTDLENFFEPISMSPVAVRSGSLSVSSDAMDEWCREMRFRSGNNHGLVSSTKPERSEKSLARKRCSKNILDKKRRYHTTGLSNTPRYTAKSQGDEIWNSKKPRQRQSHKWPGKFKSSKAVCRSCTQVSTNISSEVQAVSATCIPLSLSQHMNEMEHYQAVSIVPLTTENLIRHTRIHDWVYQYQVMNEQLVGASQTYINQQFVQPQSEEPPVKVTRQSCEPFHQAEKVDLTGIPPTQVTPKSLNNLSSVPPKENVSSWNPTTQKAYLETEYQRQMLIVPQFTQDLHARRSQEECNNHKLYLPQQPMMPNVNGKRNYCQAFAEVAPCTVKGTACCVKSHTILPNLPGCICGAQKCRAFMQQCCCSGTSHSQTTPGGLCAACSLDQCASHQRAPVICELHPHVNQIWIMKNNWHSSNNCPHNGSTNTTGTHPVAKPLSGSNGSGSNGVTLGSCHHHACLCHNNRCRVENMNRFATCKCVSTVSSIPCCCSGNRTTPLMNTFNYAISNWCNNQQMLPQYPLNHLNENGISQRGGERAPNVFFSAAIKPTTIPIVSNPIPTFVADGGTACAGIQAQSKCQGLFAGDFCNCGDPMENVVLPLEVYETNFLAHPRSNIPPELITNAPPKPTIQPKQEYPATAEGLRKPMHRFANYEHPQPVSSKVLRPPSSHDESTEEKTNDLTLLMQCKENQCTRSSTVAATTSSASRDDISKCTADCSKRTTAKNCQEAARAQNPPVTTGKSLLKI